MARLALSKLGLSGNPLKTSIDWPRLDKAGRGWTRPAWAGQGQWKSPFRVVDRPGPASAWPGQHYFQIFTGLRWPGPAQAGHVLSGPAQAGLGWPGPAQPGRFFARVLITCCSSFVPHSATYRSGFRYAARLVSHQVGDSADDIEVRTLFASRLQMSLFFWDMKRIKD